MKSQMIGYPSDAQENIRLPSERLILRFPIAATIAALDAMTATTQKLLLRDNPSMQELMDLIEEGETVPPHLFIAHNMIDNLDQIRITIHAYFQQIDARMSQIDLNDIPF